MGTDFYHEPVMLKEVIDWLLVSKTGIYVDGTVGGAGHAYEILKETDGFLVGIDCDEHALLFAETRLAEFGSRKVLVKANFAELGSVLENLQIKKVDGVLLDLGVSSPQLDQAERGFSFNQPAPLDMRMDRSLKLSAYDIVNSFAQKDLEKIIGFSGKKRWQVELQGQYRKKDSCLRLKRLWSLPPLLLPPCRPNCAGKKFIPPQEHFKQSELPLIMNWTASNRQLIPP